MSIHVVMRRLVLTYAVLLELSSGTDLCSVSKTDVTCSPCSDICPGGENSCLKCPTGCGPRCKSTCSDTCESGKCGYTQTLKLRCTHGCIDGRTGLFCQEWCPQNCVLCHQFNSTCLSCVEGHYGDNCIDTTDEHNPDTTTTSEHETTQRGTQLTESANSSVNCVTEDCDPSTGATTSGCTDGYQGSNCSQHDNPGSGEWHGTSIVIRLTGAVVLIICAAVGHKLYKVHGCPQRDIELTNVQPAIAPPVQFAPADDARESGIYYDIVDIEA